MRHSPLPRRAAAALLAPLLLATAACHRGAVRPAAPAAADSARVRADVAWLADDAREGRMTGTPGNDSAAAWIARRYAALRVAPGIPGFLQPFTARSFALAHAGMSPDVRTQNVVALIPGTDPALRGQYVVLGAHYDHLGRTTFGAADPEARDAIRNGADDNASGTAAVLELARLLRAHPTRRSVLLVHFSGEELGLLGSLWFVDHPPVPLDSVQAMLNFDMVGRLTSDKLLVYGVASAAELPAIVDSANARGRGAPLAISAIGDGFGPSDHASFFARGVPVLHFFTNVHADYHKATDDVAQLQAGGEARVIDLAYRVVRELGDRPARLTFQKSAAPPVSAGSRSGSQVYLGSVPDMSASDVTGMRLAGVTPGSPAAEAGLKEGDVIVEFDGKPVTDLYSYTDALYARQPGDTVTIVVLRGGERLTLKATLGRRGERRS